ncbi:nitrate reductase molybdenum cofactor assembly chaperone [Microlunatus sp. Gsoil 973]|uniref:nitrate reductase molybdenum cofactor assembly chaperone n=1 Tax=Microlunatus sp. Gsoil 973 TaxID=2672569 RepID=UPI0012B48F0B|nr:nitrate reductase molybdenum cofactor assembly chaperone [Microlunatus sp. Gsoil 973]QGN33815.1 nitrate reductase molybdenum cofactor assembly chaperone [Microlunatus sp. Gsoil 973]
MTLKRRRAAVPAADRLIRQVASFCLCYPDDLVSARLPELVAIMESQPTGRGRDALLDFLHAWTAIDPDERRRRYVDLFDLDRGHALYLSYWTDGDTRRRGQALARFKAQYRSSGFLLADDQELPDFLPIVLEYAAVVDPQQGSQLLQDYRASLEMLRFALIDSGSPFALVVAAVCTTLPGESPRSRAEVQQLAPPTPPVETVGLESVGPVSVELEAYS